MDDMKIVIKALARNALAMAFVFSAQVFATEVLVKVYQNNPFEKAKKHPLANISLEIIESDFGAETDVKCSKSARNTGEAKCRLINSKCDKMNELEVRYMVQLEREKFGLILNNNVFELVVKACEISPPSEFTFIYNSKKINVYKQSSSNLSTQISFIKASKLNDASIWSDASTKEKFNNYFQSIESSQVRTNITDSNNLAVLYANIANSYSQGSAEYNEYQQIAKNYEKLSVFTANQELSKVFMNPLENVGQDIKITTELKDYINNVNKIKGHKEGIIFNCRGCDKIKLEAGINLMAETPELNTTAIKGMKEVRQAIISMGNDNR